MRRITRDALKLCSQMLKLRTFISRGQRQLSSKFSRNPSRICRSRRDWSFCGPKLVGFR
ncbi:hypothetical protein LINPERPRIM_LOCUS32253 [Linum perenne]